MTKYRIIRDVDDYIRVQRKFLWWWHTLEGVEKSIGYWGDVQCSSIPLTFVSIETAKEYINSLHIKTILPPAPKQVILEIVKK